MKTNKERDYVIKLADRIESVLEGFLAARTLSREDDFPKKLTSVMIYASIAELLTRSVLQYIELHKVNKEDIGKSNLGTLLHRLKKYNFDYKDDLFRVVSEIKVARNILFHDFIDPDNHSDFNKLVKTIEDNTEELLHIWTRITHIIINGLEIDEEKYNKKYEMKDAEVEKRRGITKWRIIDMKVIDTDEEEKKVN